MMVYVAVAVLSLGCPVFAAFGNAFDNAVGHWMFGSDGTRLDDNTGPPNTSLGLIWSGEFPWGDTGHGFINDKDGYTHLRMGTPRRLYVSAINSAAELEFSQSITTWTRFKWAGGAATPIGRLMGRSGSSPNWGWNLGIPGNVYTGSATRASFYISSDGSTTLAEANG